MIRLFIIGNGFDQSHGLPTRYDNFRFFLENEYSASVEMLVEPSFQFLPNGGREYDENEVALYLYNIINQAESHSFEEDEWNDIEYSLGYVEYDEIFDYLPELTDKDGDLDYFKIHRNNEDLSANLVVPTLKINEIFSEWIRSINLESTEPNKKFENLIQRDSQFLTFNYTYTLEKIYGISSKKIRHIHGEQEAEIIFGHGNRCERYNEFSHMGAEDNLEKIHQSLRKPVQKIIDNNADFYSRLTNLNISEIYLYGFSMNDTDADYIKEIIKKVDTKNITWFFNDYKPPSESNSTWLENLEKLKVKLKKWGFKGRFSTFSTNNNDNK